MLEGWRIEGKGRRGESLSSDLEHIACHVTDIGGSDGDRRNGHPAAEFRRLNPRVPGQIPGSSDPSFPAECRADVGCRREDRRRNGEKGERGEGGGRGVIVLQNNLNFNYFGELQKRRCDSLTVCHRKINWLPSLPIAPLRPRSKLSYDPLSPFLSSPLASSLPPPPPPPSTFPFHPPPPFLRRRRPHHRRRHPLVDQLLGAKRGGDRTPFSPAFRALSRCN